jgi:hypothetical protein
MEIGLKLLDSVKSTRVTTTRASHLTPVLLSGCADSNPTRASVEGRGPEVNTILGHNQLRTGWSDCLGG